MSKLGHVFQINVSLGGVPKQGIHVTQITDSGLAEDRIGHPKKQAGSDRAICLYSLEKILALQEEGHPIFPGSCGENITITGIDWDEVQVGSKIKLGKDTLVEVTEFTKPCAMIMGSFKDCDIMRISQGRHPGWSRVYAKVLSPGQVAIGDEVKIVS